MLLLKMILYCHQDGVWFCDNIYQIFMICTANMYLYFTCKIHIYTPCENWFVGQLFSFTSVYQKDKLEQNNSFYLSWILSNNVIMQINVMDYKKNSFDPHFFTIQSSFAQLMLAAIDYVLKSTQNANTYQKSNIFRS